MDLHLQYGKYHSNDGQGQKETQTCYYCGKTGHLAKNCWQRLGQGLQRQHGKSAFMGAYEKREYQSYGYGGTVLPPPPPPPPVDGNSRQGIDTVPKN